MPNQHHHGPPDGQRDSPNERVDLGGAEQRRLQAQRNPPSAGGRSESFSRQRDAEQLRAGYSPEEWERSDWPRNTRSEPDWDPERGVPAGARESMDTRAGQRSEEDRDDANRRYDRNEPGPAAREHGRGERRGEHAGLGQQLADAGRRLLGKAERIIRNPKNYRRSDARIREEVRDRLSMSPAVDPTHVEVTVSNGEVTLAGTVATLPMKFRAEEIADDVAGVHDVHNQLRLTRRP